MFWGYVFFFPQTLYLCGPDCSRYRLLNCCIRSLLSGKRKRKTKNLSFVNLKACKMSSWDLFQAGPTGTFSRLVGADNWMLRKKFTQPPYLLTAAILRILDFNFLKEGVLPSGKRNTTEHLPPCIYTQYRDHYHCHPK